MTKFGDKFSAIVLLTMVTHLVSCSCGFQKTEGKERKAGTREITWKHTDLLYKVTHMRIWVLNEVNENKI